MGTFLDGETTGSAESGVLLLVLSAGENTFSERLGPVLEYVAGLALNLFARRESGDLHSPPRLG